MNNFVNFFKTKLLCLHINRNIMRDLQLVCSWRLSQMFRNILAVLVQITPNKEIKSISCIAAIVFKVTTLSIFDSSFLNLQISIQKTIYFADSAGPLNVSLSWFHSIYWSSMSRIGIKIFKKENLLWNSILTV